MPHDPRARPTIAVLRDLKDGWTGPWERRLIERHQWEDLRPLAELAHPILVKAREVMGSDPAQDHPRGRIECSDGLALAEIRSGQWRAGVWTDADGVRWVVAVGLAKGGHRDNDDFYETLAVCCATPAGRGALKPTDADRHLLKTETAALVMTFWELGVQGACAELLRVALDKGVHQLPMPDPVPGRPPMAEARLTFAIEDGVEEFVVEILNPTRSGSALSWKLERRVLVSIAPPCQDWDVAGGIYSAMEAVGHGRGQLAVLSDAAARGELLSVDLGQVAHRVHRRHIGGSLVDGTAIRALCGVFFVATQKPDQLEECPYCREMVTS